MAFRVGDVFGLICSHPIAFIAVLLLFTPPLFPIVVYFSPLLISTALVVLAMVSMGSHVEPKPAVVETEVHYYKRGWIEEVSEDGPEEEEREPKRLKAASPKEDRWLNKMKNWKGTGRAWMESVLTQESEASTGGGDHNGTRKKDSRPFLSAAKELFSHESNKQARGNEQKLSRRDEDQKAADMSDQSALTVMTFGSSGDSKSGELTEVSGNAKTEITSKAESEGGSKENSSESTPSSPLFRARTASRREAGGLASGRDLNIDDVSSTSAEDPSKPLQIISSSAAEKGKEKDLATVSAVENHATLPSGKKDEAETSNKVVGNDKAQTLEIVPVEGQSPSKVHFRDHEVQKSEAHNSLCDKDCEKESDAAQSVTTDANADGTGIVTDKPYPIGSTQVVSNKPSRLATELLGQGNAVGGADSPSAAVALSEKLKVPLADIMSLLTGDEKDNANLDSGPGTKASTSSESTTSQEEEWSSSDGESTSAAPAHKSDADEQPPSEQH